MFKKICTGVKRKIFDRTESDIQDVVVISDLDEAFSEVSNELPPTPPPSRLSFLLAAPTVAIGKRTVTAPDPATGRKTFSASSDENVAACATLTAPNVAIREKTITARVPAANRKTISASSASLADPSVAIRKVSVTAIARVPAAGRKTFLASTVSLEAPSVAIEKVSLTATAPVPAVGGKTIPASSVFLETPMMDDDEMQKDGCETEDDAEEG
jgi:hypothetical protein